MILWIVEIFGLIIQGEGVLIGELIVFVWVGGCDYCCSWCDSLYVVDSVYCYIWIVMSYEVVFDKVCILFFGQLIIVLISGGNFVIQDFGLLIVLGKVQGYCFVCEI